MKKIFALLLALFLFTANFIGCAEDTPELKDPNNEENQPPVQDTENPASDFRYEENHQGGITITSFIGDDTNIIIPEKIEGKDVTHIGSNAFRGRDNMISVTLPDTVIEIGTAAFAECDSLTTVVLSKSLTTITNYAFEKNPLLTSIVLPSSLTSVGSYIFQDCISLKQINIPKSLTDWHSHAFSYCGLETVTFEEGLETIGFSAFSVTKIKHVTLPNSLIKLEPYAFSGCVELETVELNEGLTTIDDLAFHANTKLQEIIIPASVTNLTDLAFSECSALKKLMFEGNAPDGFKSEDELLPVKDVNFTVYYHENAIGFTTHEWCGYPTEIW